MTKDIDRKEFYWECRSADVLADESLALIQSPQGWPDEGLSCVGLYWLMLNVMHRSPRKGYLLDPFGAPPKADGLAKLARRSERVVARLMGLILAAGLFDVDPEGTISSRAMTRQVLKRAKLRENGKKGGNPALNEIRITNDLTNMDNQTLSIRLRTKEFNHSNAGPGQSEEIDPFDEFWRAFPPRRKYAKATARKAFEAACAKKPSADIISAIKEYAQSPISKGDYARGPASWLNDECWDDDRQSWLNGEEKPETHEPTPPPEPESPVQKLERENAMDAARLRMGQITQAEYDQRIQSRETETEK